MKSHTRKSRNKFVQIGLLQWRTESGGEGLGGSNPRSEIPKVLQNRSKLNPIVKTVKNCWIYSANTPRCSEKGQLNSKTS